MLDAELRKHVCRQLHSRVHKELVGMAAVPVEQTLHAAARADAPVLSL